jgi:8-oxo-dGTP diphosphatase
LAVKKFPAGTYGRQILHFFPAPYKAPLRAFAALVFPWQNEQVLLCNIEDRGWCIPSGRVEAFESSLDAVRREAMEEAGAVLSCLQYIGCYSIRDKDEQRWADVFVGKVVELQEISMPEESLGRKLVVMGELPELYHEWTDLTKAVFEHSYEILTRALKY